MKFRLVRLCQWLLGILGISASISSCDGMLVEYGQPNMDYSVKGRVVDSQTGAGVAGIEVSRARYGSQIDTTDADGGFYIEGNSFSSKDFQVSLKDIDLEAHGAYKDALETIQLKQVKEGDGHWYEGAFEAKEVILKMEKQESE